MIPLKRPSVIFLFFFLKRSSTIVVVESLSLRDMLTTVPMSMAKV